MYFHNLHWGINLPLKTPTLSFLPSPLLNLQIVQAPFFKQSLPIYLFFVNPRYKSDFSVNPHNIKVFHP